MLRFPLLIAVLIFSEKSNAQKVENDKPSKFFYKLYAGYGFLTPGSYTVSSQHSINYTRPIGVANSISKKSEAEKGLGHTFRLGGGIGIIQTDFLNIGLDAELLMKNEITNTLNTFVEGINYVTSHDTISSRMVTLTPHVIFKALAKPNFFIYNKLGVLLTLPFTLNTSGKEDRYSALEQQVEHPILFGVQYDNALIGLHDKGQLRSDIKYKMSLGIGVNVAFGINYRVSNTLRIFGEVFGNYTGLSPKSSRSKTFTYQKFTYKIDTTNFHQEIPFESVSFTDNTTVYQKDGAIDLTGPQFTTRKYTFNMSAIGINVGIVRRFR